MEQRGASKRARGVGIAAIVLLACGPFANAQGRDAAVSGQTFRPALDAGGLPSMAVAELLPSLVATGAVTFDFALAPMRVSVPDVPLPQKDIVSRRLDAHLSGALGLFGWIEVGAELPIVAYQSGLDTPFARETLGFGGLRSAVLGDLYLQGRLKLLGQRGAVPALSAGLGVTLPTGKRDALASEGAVVLSPFVSLSERLGLHVLAASLGIRHHQPGLAIGDVEISDQITGQVGLQYMLKQEHFDRHYAVVTELAGDTSVRPVSVREGGTNLEARVGVRFIYPGTRPVRSATLGAGVGILRGYGTPLARLFVGFDFMSEPPTRDSDEDGVPDRFDQCAGASEDRDGFEDSDGCSDPDNDGDGIADEDDECPNAAETIRFGYVGTGCPAPDAPDADKDGVPDKEDRCPNEVEDYDRFADSDGCPDPDNDGDGLSDLGDMCPDAAEDRNSFEDDDGCPDGGRGARYVDIKGTRVLFQRALSFTPDTAALGAENGKILDQLGALLRDRTDIERLRISVHPAHKSRLARDLAKARALAIVQELERRGVPSSRLSGQSGSWDRKLAEQINAEVDLQPVQQPTPKPGKRRR